ncbi:hypothetical protein [Aquihabitans sp. McL0605]|uniref:hypothetical protein n=1 Tax=Aquihabitans sp. McL0605 TaxID=3415671 RepID=UPI003CE9FE60
MTRTSQAARWLAAVGLVVVSVIGITAAAQHADTGHRDGAAVLTPRSASPAAAVVHRGAHVRPAPLWWVSAFAALLVILVARRVDAAEGTVVRARTSWSGRYDRGPPAGLAHP